ncbi:hypothetical protein V8E36_001070 [Tilletia maclaganii]
MFSKDELRGYLDRYDEALQVRSEIHATSRDVAELDQWARTTLRNLLQERKKDKDGAYMNKDEMLKLMRWKLARGKWRPRLEQYIEEHSEQAIKDATRASFAALDEVEDNDHKNPIPRDVLRKLTQLKGIGPATGSAVLAAYEPTRIPFLSDEAAIGVGQLGSKPDYTEAFFDRYTTRMHERVAEEGWESVDELERACYAAGIIEKYGTGKEGAERREEGKYKDAQAVIDKAKHSATAEQRTAKGARPDAATAHGGDVLEDDAKVDGDTAGENGGASSSKRKLKASTKSEKDEKGSAQPNTSEASRAKKRKRTEAPRQGERKSARLSST